MKLLLLLLFIFFCLVKRDTLLFTRRVAAFVAAVAKTERKGQRPGCKNRLVGRDCVRPRRSRAFFFGGGFHSFFADFVFFFLEEALLVEDGVTELGLDD